MRDHRSIPIGEGGALSDSGELRAGRPKSADSKDRARGGGSSASAVNDTRLNDGAIVHQALHGYEQGHRLLAASVPLPVPAERSMLALSDASGPQPPSKFTECLTGYAVPATEWYALAYTWPAPEMHRP